MNKKKEIVLIYNSGNKKDREALALLTSLSNHIVNEFDLQKNNLTPRQIAEFAYDLGVDTIDILDHRSEDFRESYKNTSDDDLLKIINNNITLLKTPIIKVDGKTEFFKTPYDAHPIDLEMKNGNKL